MKAIRSVTNIIALILTPFLRILIMAGVMFFSEIDLIVTELKVKKGRSKHLVKGDYWFWED